MVDITVKWHADGDLFKMRIQIGKKTIFDDLISKVSLNEIKEFFGETIEDPERTKDRNGNDMLTGFIKDEDICELYEYFDIDPPK